MSDKNESLFDGIDFGGADDGPIDVDWENEPTPGQRGDPVPGAGADDARIVIAPVPLTGEIGVTGNSRGRARGGPGDGELIAITVWGAPRSGKTTFLRAMPFAADEPVSGYLWNISGCDVASREFLNNGVKQVIRDQIFPPASVGSIPLAWRFRGRKPRPARPGLFGWFADRLYDDAAESDIEFVVEVADVAGEVYAEKEGAPRGLLREQTLDTMARADGIVYLFDPIGANEEATNSFDYYVDTVERLKELAEESGTLVGTGQLPQHVAVCVTKLDEPQVFEAAETLVYSAESDALPEIPGELAAQALRDLCRDRRSLFVCDRLERDFVPSRIKYYVTSAAGFHLVDGRFDRGDFSNRDGNNVRSVARPINVLEPVVSLYQRIVHGVDGR